MDAGPPLPLSGDRKLSGVRVSTAPWRVGGTGRSGAPPHREQVRVEAEEGRLALHGAGGLEQAFPLRGVGPALLEVGEEPARPLYPQEIEQLEARLAHFRLQLLRPMEEGCREVVLGGRIPVLPVAQVARDDGGELGIGERVLEDTRQKRGEAIHGGGEEQTARLENAMGFP